MVVVCLAKAPAASALHATAIFVRMLLFRLFPNALGGSSPAAYIACPLCFPPRT